MPCVGKPVLLGANQVAAPPPRPSPASAPAFSSACAREAKQFLRLLLHNIHSKRRINHGQDDRTDGRRRPQARGLRRGACGQAARRHRRDPGDLRRQQPHPAASPTATRPTATSRSRRRCSTARSATSTSATRRRTSKRAARCMQKLDWTTWRCWTSQAAIDDASKARQGRHRRLLLGRLRHLAGGRAG